MSLNSKIKADQKLKHLKDWRLRVPAKKSQGRFPHWVKVHVVELAIELGIDVLSKELDIGQRTIARWVQEFEKNEESLLDGAESRIMVSDRTPNIVTVKTGTTEIVANVDAATVKRVLSILF